VVKEGYGAPSAAQLRRERFERLKVKANASQERSKKRIEEKRIEAGRDVKQREVQQVGQLAPNVVGSDSDSDTEEVTFKPARMKAVVAENKWFSNLEQQMGDLQGDLNQLREGMSPKANANTPPLPQPSALAAQPSVPKAPSPSPSPREAAKPPVPSRGKKPPLAAKVAVTPPTAQELALRKVKREEESKNLREFVRAQRSQMVSLSSFSLSLSLSLSFFLLILILTFHTTHNIAHCHFFFVRARLLLLLLV
jgi:hypothetical protein